MFEYLDPSTVLLAAALMFFAGLVQGAVGFAFGLIAVPALLLMGVPLPVGLAGVLVCVLAQSGGSAWHLRHEAGWPIVLQASIGRMVGMAVGTYALVHLVSLPPARIRFAVGCVVFLFTLLQVLWRPQPRDRLPSGWGWFAFLSSGFTAGVCGMGGPPIVLWVMAHNWSNRATRAFLLRCYLIVVPWQFALLFGTFGGEILSGVALGFLFVPAVIAGTAIGLRVGNRFSKVWLRRLAYAVLLVIAINAMLPRP